MKRTITITCLTIASAFYAVQTSTPAHARGHVLAVDGNKIYVDLGAKDGVGPGSTLTLLHAIEAIDPVTSQKLRDTFPIGRLTVVKVGSAVCLARASKKLLRRVRNGDEVSLASPRRVFVDPWLEHIRRQRTLPRSTDPEQRRQAELRRMEARIKAAELIRATWLQTLNKTPEQAIAVWRGFVYAHPRSPYRSYARREINKLRGLVHTEKRLLRDRPGGDKLARMRVARLAALVGDLAVNEPLALRAPAQLYARTPLSLAFTVLRPNRVGKAWLYYRHRGQKNFRRIGLGRNGDNYLRATVPAAQIRAPGIELFVEALDPSGGKPAAVWASEALPHTIPVSPRIEKPAPSRANRSRVTLFTDYVDFDGGLNKGFDQYLHAEVDFMYRFYKPVYAMRVGFGTLGGVGGPKDTIDDAPDTCIDATGQYRCRRVAFHYAYTELEFRYSKLLAFMVRPQFGHGTSDSRANGQPGRCDGTDLTDCEIFSAFGLRARVRIGDERQTNLTLGVGVTDHVGTVFEAAFTWDVMPTFPVVLTAQVTDQPVIENFGVRLIGDVGWRAVDWFYPSLRLSFQARDVDHDGFSAGLAMNFDW